MKNPRRGDVIIHSLADKAGVRSRAKLDRPVHRGSPFWRVRWWIGTSYVSDVVDVSLYRCIKRAKRGASV